MTLVIINSLAITRGAHHADAPRYSFHRCPRNTP